MLTVDELRQKAEAYAYQRDGMSLKDFEEWFEDNSIDADDNAELNELRIAIDAAFAEYHFDRIGEVALREELVAAIRPFAQRWEKLFPNLFLLKNKKNKSESAVVASGKTVTVRKPPLVETSPAQTLVASTTRSRVLAAVPVPA